VQRFRGGLVFKAQHPTPGINGGVVNVFAQFDVTLYDSFGNRRNQGGEPVLNPKP